jgi:glucose/sorbosone dehydrogenase
MDAFTFLDCCGCCLMRASLFEVLRNSRLAKQFLKPLGEHSTSVVGGTDMASGPLAPTCVATTPALFAFAAVGAFLLIFAPAPNQALRAQTTDTVGRHTVELLDTALLPLIKDTLAMPHGIEISAGRGGGITVVGDTIIVADRRGAFFQVDGRGARIRKLVLPAIPNNSAAYDEFGPRPQKLGPIEVNDRDGFRVHDIESRIEAQGIRVFVSYERFLPEQKTTALAVSAITLDAKDLVPTGSWEDIYLGQPLVAEWYAGVGSGGRMVVKGDTLYLTVGDYNQDNVFMHSALEAQNPNNDFGKILSIDLRTKAKTRISMGHRNPQGLTITLAGTIYSTDHGPRGGDLLNRVVQGKNYGWPLRTYGTHYNAYDWPNHKLNVGDLRFETPTFVWVPSIAVSNLIEVTNFHPIWDGDLLIESLKMESLYRLRQDGQGRVLYSEPIWVGERLRDIAVLADGTLVLWTDLAHLIFLTVDTKRLATNERLWDSPPSMLSDSIRRATLAPYSLGERVQFSQYGNGLRYLGPGWSFAESHGTWTDAEAASIGLRLDAAAHENLRLMMTFIPFLTEKHAQQVVDVGVNGRALARWKFENGEPQRPRCAVIPGELAAQQELRIALQIQHPMSPVKLGLSTDDRMLGVAALDMTISPGTCD